MFQGGFDCFGAGVPQRHYVGLIRATPDPLGDPFAKRTGEYSLTALGVHWSALIQHLVRARHNGRMIVPHEARAKPADEIEDLDFLTPRFAVPQGISGAAVIGDVEPQSSQLLHQPRPDELTEDPGFRVRSGHCRLVT